MDNVNQNIIFNKMREIDSKLNSECNLSYLEENMSFMLEVGKYYNNIYGSMSMDNGKQIMECYAFFTRYLILYMAKKYNKTFNYKLASDYEKSCFYLNTIHLSKNIINKLDFEHIAFIIFHEFRHKMQHDDVNNLDNVDNILQIDPATIILLKEKVTQRDSDLYNANHNCFVMENDANLFALSECKQLMNTKILEDEYRSMGEATNYIISMINGTNLSDQDFNDKQNLPIIYEEDYRFKIQIAGKNIPKKSLLNLIYHSNGKPKSYQELMDEKNELIKKYNGQTVNRKTSTTNYQKWTNSKSSKEHIEEIYKLIIASDPILTIQECFYRYNNIDNKLIAKKHADKIKTILEDCPKIVDLYQSEIKSILSLEIRKGNKDAILEIVKEHPTLEFYVSNYIKLHPELIKNNAPDDSYERNQEMHQIDNSHEKASLHRPIISESVKQSVILNNQKQKLHEMKQQLLDYQQGKQQEQEAMNNEEEQEDSFGMSM